MHMFFPSLCPQDEIVVGPSYRKQFHTSVVSAMGSIGFAVGVNYEQCLLRSV